MTGRSIAVIFVASWFLLDPAAARSLARDLDAGAAIGINDRSTSSGITFHGRSLQNGTTELVFQVAGKLILISVQGDAAGGGRRVSIRGSDLRSGEVARLSFADSQALREYLGAVLAEPRGGPAVEPMILRALNLLAAWPPGLPLDRSLDAAAPLKSLRRVEPALTSACELPLPVRLSEDLCSEMNQLHPGDFISQGILLGWIIEPILGRILPLQCTEQSVVVGPFPFESGGCMGRCGRGCVGDGPPNNELNIFTQNCFNHDLCVLVLDDLFPGLGFLHPYCNQMFVYTIVDFFFGSTCSPAGG